MLRIMLSYGRAREIRYLPTHNPLKTMTAHILTRTTNFGPCEVIHKSFVAAETRCSLFNAVGRLCVRGFVIQSVLRDETGDVNNVVLVSQGTRYSYSVVEKVVTL